MLASRRMAMICAVSFLAAGGQLLYAAAADPNAVRAATNTVFSPRQFVSNGKLDLDTAVTLTFDTDALTVRTGAVTIATGTNGVSQSEAVQMAVFCFKSINLGSAVSVVVTGDQGIALLSRGDMTLNTELRVDGRDGRLSDGHGGSGAEGGALATSFQSNPPGADRGDGGAQGNTLTPGGDGVGHGAAPGAAKAKPGGGAGHGGQGGDGNDVTAVAGTNYGSHVLADLYGGSGGGGGVASAGGGGGGTIELCADGTIVLGASGLLSACGGGADLLSAGNVKAGGGGSGGGIILAARTIVLEGTVNITVNGGSVLHDTETPGGGGGGGGRVAFYAHDWDDYREAPYTNHPSQVSIEGGTGYNPGGCGTFYGGEAPDWLTKLGTVIKVF